MRNAVQLAQAEHRGVLENEAGIFDELVGCASPSMS